MTERAAVLAPGGRIGILGGGQLGRMLAMAAARLGYRVHIYCPDAEAPAAGVAAAHIRADYEDAAALDRFAAAVDIVTYEFENVPAWTVARLAERLPVRPGAKALAVAQDRLQEKRLARELGIGTAPFAAVAAATELPEAIRAVGLPALLKTRRLGYDGKGQALIAAPEEAAAAFARLGGVPAILEGHVDFSRELSVVAARGKDGQVVAFDLAENRHEAGILRRTIAPAPMAGAQTQAAQDIAAAVARALEYVGVLAIELFETREGHLLFNEIAPRVHNSGHWTIEACRTSQFEQHIRAICGLPLGSPEALLDAEMTNLLGEEVENWPAILAEPGAALHLYGKTEALPGRKMGHVTRLWPRRHRNASD